MKKIIKAIMLTAATVVAVLSCAKENVREVQQGVSVHFSTAELSTKSHFGDKTDDAYPVLWTEGQQVGIVYSGGTSAINKAAITPSEDLKTASFSKEFEASSTASAHNFYVISPADAAIGYSDSNSSFNIDIPSSQTPADGTCDEKAQITVASHISETFDTEISNLQFSHVTAYGRLSVTLPEGAGEISSIALNASKNISGRYFHSFETGNLSENSPSATITLNTSKTQDIFFGCAPVDLTDELLEVVVTTANGTYEKIIDFSTAAKPLKFEAGGVSKFSVADFTKKESDEVYTLVTDASTLKIGDKVIIAAAESESDYAISTTQNGNNRSQASLTKTGNTIVNPGKDVQLFTLESGSVSGTWAFSTGSGYIHAASSSNNYLRTQSSLDANASWTIICTASGIATIKAQGANTRNIIQYNGSSSLFSCYASASQQDVAIYTDGKGTASLPNPPTIVLSATEIILDYNDETVHEVTATISGQEGEITCVACDDKDGQTESSWLTAAYENGKVSCLAEKNTTASKRTAYIIVSASNADGKTVGTITVTQGKEELDIVIYTCGFESSEGFTAGTSYQSTVTSGSTGKQWKVYYGTPSTSSAISDSQSIAMRLYSSNNYGYAQMEFDLKNVTKVEYKAKAATTKSAEILLNTFYSTDGGTNWTSVDTDKSLTTTAASYSFVVSESGEYENVRVKFAISSNSTKPSSSNSQLTIDDVVIYGIN